jgi:hypothetical protein
MKVTLESTSKIVQHSLGCGESVEVRVWEGTTETGLPIRAFLTTIAPQDVEDLQRFDGELRAGLPGWRRNTDTCETPKRNRPYIVRRK